MNPDDRFDRLDDLARELEGELVVHLVDIGTNEDEIVATADVGGVRVQAWYDDDGDLCVVSNDERFDDPDDVLEHVNEVSSDDGLCAVLEEAEWRRSQHGNTGLSDYRDRLRGD